MADMDKFYDDLVIINLRYPITFWRTCRPFQIADFLSLCTVVFSQKVDFLISNARWYSWLYCNFLYKTITAFKKFLQGVS